MPQPLRDTGGSAVRAFPPLLTVVGVLFLAIHLWLLPASLEDIDSLNFALALRDYDISRHQPHPPGYPVFVALGKTADGVLERVASLDRVEREAVALAVWGALFGAAGVLPLFRLFGALERNPGRARAATVLTLLSPLFWFTAGRPMSDVPGLVVGLSAMAALAVAFRRQRPLGPRGEAIPRGPRTAAIEIASGRMFVLGALLAGLAAGFRAQTLWLTVPLLIMVLMDRVGRGAAGAIIGGSVTFGLGVAVWAIPMLIAAGGPLAYWGAVTKQAGQDFSGVDLLATRQSVRGLALGLYYSWAVPWARLVLAVPVLAAAAAGGIAMLKGSRSGAALLVVGFAPYLIFHLLFHELITTRYALPLVPLVAYLAVRGLDTLRRPVMPAGVATLCGISMAITIPAQAAYAGAASPAFRALEDLEREWAAGPDTPTVAAHQVFHRTLEAAALEHVRLLPGPPMREWLELVDYWRGGGTDPVWFLADPRRTDLELVAPDSRSKGGRYRWNFDRRRFMSGVRPDLVEIVRIASPPAWFGAEGWHLTPETLGMSERSGVAEAMAYITPTDRRSMLFLGAQRADGAGRAPVRIELRLDDRVIAEGDLTETGALLERVELPAIEPPQGARFATLRARAVAPDGSPAPGVRFTHLSLEPVDRVSYVLWRGWHEREYDAGRDRSWRWAGPAAEIAVHPAGRDLQLHLTGESPLASFDRPSRLVVRAGETILATATLSEDFDLSVPLAPDALEAAGGRVTVETDQFFVPAERSGSPDRRPLGLRFYEIEVTPAGSP